MITVDWGNHDETLLIFRIHQHWTLDEFKSMVQRSQKLIHSKQYPIYILADVQTASKAPHNFLPTIVRGLSSQPPQDIHIIVISKSVFWQRLWNMIQAFNFHSIPVYFVHDANEAYALIETWNSAI